MSPERQNPDLFRVLTQEEWDARMADAAERARFEAECREALRKGYEAISGPAYAIFPRFL